ncbi:Hsp20/alpha crystallin family protein [Natranaerobius thermophilus]|uniref:SHSP domain-containing protein n=1 Tax=Natranaerobius thermophilus (strain ATCC BAA-1301 / DSM 18059 / JW/NM-WN-LF) TaxID=457570 RepID=B2A6P7_NATTJ|nr:Hsp20/alpha crystallin family protein [Natranaerobius thermophilus]ACB84180.1 hypothetical protein Nther_0585 [Natranaerobius thermophilus JW/NM-WN-LF]
MFTNYNHNPNSKPNFNDNETTHEFRATLESIVNNFDNELVKSDDFHKDAYEYNGYLVIELELPGIKNANISIANNTMYLTGEWDKDDPIQTGLPLPSIVDTNRSDQISWEHCNEILRVYLPLSYSD